MPCIEGSRERICVLDDGDNLPGTIAKYTCDYYGFRLVGSNKRLCQKYGSWAGEAPICERKTTIA